jgi:hypothetical protein
MRDRGEKLGPPDISIQKDRHLGVKSDSVSSVGVGTDVPLSAKKYAIVP